MGEVISIAPIVIVRRDIFGSRCLVEILPRRVDRPTEFFRNRLSALCFAEELSARHGWRIDDQTGARDDGPHAA